MRNDIASAGLSMVTLPAENLEVPGLRKEKRIKARLSTAVMYATQKRVRNLGGDLGDRCGESHPPPDGDRMAGG
jgi:hypothetical protein